MNIKKFMAKTKLTEENLNHLQNLSKKEGFFLMKKLPKKTIAGLYAKFCTPEQITQLLEEYAKFIEHPEEYPDTPPEIIKKRYSKKMTLLLKALKRNRKPIPSKYLKYLQ